MIPHWDAQGRPAGETLWCDAYFREQCELTGVIEDGEAATQWYPWADRGGVIELTGEPWDCCPRWYAAFAPPPVRRVVRRALKWARWREKGSLSEITATPLMPAAVDLIALAEAARTLEERRQHEQAIEDAKKGGR